MEMMEKLADAGDDTSGDGNEEETKEYYYDSGDGVCKLDGKKRPKWLTTLYEDFEECCDLSWAKSSCLTSKHNPDKNKDSSGDDVENSDRKDSPIFIELTMRGSMDLLNMEELPSQTSRTWTRLKRVITKSITLIMSEFSQMVHSEHMEVDLGSIDGVAFNWRRERRLDEEGQEGGGIEEDAEDNMDVEEDVEETTPTSSLRGGNLVVLQQQQQQERRLVTSKELKFELTVLAKCDDQCQSDTLVALGTSTLNAINTYFQTAVSSGSFAVMLKKEGNALGLFRNGAPSASNGKLTYVYAEKSTLGVDEGLTWAPTPGTTPSPTDGTSAPTLDMYYPQTEDVVCKSGDGHSDTNVYFYGTMEECCKFPWMGDYEVCMYNSKLASRPSWRPTTRRTPSPVRTKRPRTKRPTMGDSSPTNVEAKAPKTKRPTKKPTKAPKTKRPTKMPIKQNSSPTGPGRPNTPTPPTNPEPNPVENPTGNGAVVYYPDLNLGVCKFDGLHGNNPYQFPTAAACCNNRWMDYDKCMAYADPYLVPPKYYPDIYAGYCKSDGGDVGLDEHLVFDGAEECCNNVWMVFAECVVKSLSGTPPSAAKPTGPVAPTDPGALNDPNPPTTVPPTPDPSPYPTTDPTYATPDPSPYPTYHPTEGIIVPSDVTGEFYRDFHAGLCLADGKQFGQIFTFDTLEDCCTSNSMDYQDCLALSLEEYDYPVLNSCMWYPDPVKFGTCTYSSLYPESWARAEKKDMYLFNDHERCCVKAYGGPGCKQNYWCNGANSGPTPTGYVTQPPTTEYPTFYPTKPEPRLTAKPTGRPITKPTRRPVTKPTGPTNTRRPTKQPTEVAPAAPPSGITTALDNELGFPWQTSPGLPWTTSDWDETGGRYSARSHIGIQAGEQSDLSILIKSGRGGLLTFDFKSDVRMPHHGCYINLDGVTLKGFTFPTDWMSEEVDIPPGDSVVLFRAWSPNLGMPAPMYDVSGTIGVDNVRFRPS